MDNTEPTKTYGSPGIRLGLERVRALRERHSTQSDPFRPTWRMIHVAGTKGKGSTTEFIHRLLIAAGYSVGAFFSPYVCHPREQILINGEPIADSLFAETIAELQENAVALGATEFEITTATAYLLFDRAEVDFAVVEVGVGGREDATNIIENPVVSVLTPIGLDHQDLLGNTIEEIAEHKAGILRHDVPAVVNVPDARAHAVLAEEAESVGTVIDDVRWLAGDRTNSFIVWTPLRERGPLIAGMPGPFQRQNAATAVIVLDRMAAELQIIPLTLAALQEGLNAAHLPGRFQRMQESPARIIADGAHNELSAQALADALRQEMSGATGKQRLFLVVGMKQNHAVEPFLRPFADLHPAGLVATVPVSGGQVRSGVHPAATIAEVATNVGIPVLGIAEDVVSGIHMAQSQMTEGDLLCVCGSFVLVGDLVASGEFPTSSVSPKESSS